MRDSTASVVPEMTDTGRPAGVAEAVLNASEEGICALDAEGKVGFLNPTAERILQRSENEVLGQSYSEAFYGELAARVGAAADEPISATLRTGVAVRGKTETFMRRDGSAFPATCVVTPLGEAGGRVGAVVLFRDVSERVATEESLREQAAGLARSNEDLEHFAYVASHDLQEPLRIVSGYLDLLKRRYAGRLDKDADEFIEYAVDAAKRMQGMIRALLEYSRVGTLGAALQRTESGAAAREALSNLRVAIEESGAEISLGDLPVVRADPSQLGQLFQNLISNGIKFSDKKSPRVNVAAERRNGEWRFCVWDNGVGFDPADADRLFMIFQRLHSREKYPGTGIGLAICKKIVERHGGRIWAEAEEGVGATFRFTLPVVHEAVL